MTAPGFTESCTKGTRLAAEASTMAHANPTDPRSVFLSSNNNQCFIQVEPTGQALFQTADIAFIYLHSAHQQITSRPYHGTAQFMQPKLSHTFAVPGLVAVPTRWPRSSGWSPTTWLETPSQRMA